MMIALRLINIFAVVLLAIPIVIVASMYPGLAVLAAICGLAMLRRKAAHWAFGTARWAEAKDIPHLLEGRGLMVGHLSSRPSKWDGLKALFSPRLPARIAVQRWIGALQRKPTNHLVRLTNSVHSSIFAPVGAGKSTGLVIPWLLTNPESAVVVDFKGELAEKTAEARKRMGHKIVLLDPFRALSQTEDQPLYHWPKDTFNPLQYVDGQSEAMIDECRDIAEAIVTRTGQEKDPHFNDKAEQDIGITLCGVAHFANDADKSLQSMREVLANGDKREALIKLMQESPEMGGILSRLGHAIAHSGKEELGSILSTVQRHTRFLDTPAIVANTKASTFDPADLRKGKMTVFLILPPDHMRAQSALLRMWITSMFRAVIRCGLQENKKVHFILDEAASLGHMDAIDDAIDKYRGYGIRLQLYYQSIGQLKKCFPDGQDQTLLSNTTQVFFGVNDQQTAEYVSNRPGEQTIILTSGGTSRGSSMSNGENGRTNWSHSENANSNWNQHGRKLLTPDEVTRLSPRVALTFAPGLPPICTTLIRYYERGFPPKSGLGFWKCAFDTVAMLVCAAVMTTISTAVYLKENPRAAREVRQMYERVKESMGPGLPGFGDDPDLFKE